MKLLPTALMDVVRTGSFEVMTPPPPAVPVIRTVVYINGDVVTTVCEAASDESIVTDHFCTVAARGQAASEQLRSLHVGARVMWLVFYGLVTLWTTVAFSWVTAVVVVASAVLTVALGRVRALKARISWPLDLLKIALLVVLALLSNKIGRDHVAVGCVVSAVLDLIVLVALEAGRILVRRTLRGLGVSS